MSDSTAVMISPEPMRVRGVQQEVYDKQVSLREDLEGAMPQLMSVMPRGMKADALVSMVLTCALDNPDLLECEPLSLVRSTFKMAALGLRPGETCDIVPTKKKNRKLAECWIRVKGVVQLAIQSRAIQWASVGYIVEGDEWSEDEDGRVKHRRQGTPKADASNVTHVYARIILQSGVKVDELWSRERILEHRDRYAKNLKYQDGTPNRESPWNKDPLPMWAKTVVKSSLRFAPLSAELRQAIDAGDDLGDGQFAVVEGANDPTAALRAGAGVLALGDGDENGEADAMTLADAEAFVVRNKALRDIKTTRLGEIREWALTNENARLAAACEIVMSAREDQEHTDELVGAES